MKLMKPMKPMKRIAMPAIVIAALALSACGGGGGGGMMAAKPAAAEPGREPETDPVAEPAPAREPEPEPLPDPATLLRSHDRLAFPDGFTAIQVDEAMFLLANMPYREGQAGGGQAGGVAVADANIFLRSESVAPYAASRAATYRADHAVIDGPLVERVVRVNPQVVTEVQGGHPRYSVRDSIWGDSNRCVPSRGECTVHHPAEPGVSDGEGRPVKTPIENMPFLSNAMREYSEGVRTRNGVNLRYWSSGERAVPWAGWKVDTATDTWSGYGAWQDWSGFGLVMLSHNHQWDLYDSAWNYVIAGGDLTGSRPSPEMAGTYRGAAVARAYDLSFIADGSVEMTVRLGANPSLDINIGDWRGYELTSTGAIGRPTAISIDNISEAGLTIAEDGTFKKGRIISGAFYGPGGGEAAGVFQKGASSGDVITTGVYGAFGARKPDDPQ